VWNQYLLCKIPDSTSTCTHQRYLVEGGYIIQRGLWIQQVIPFIKVLRNQGLYETNMQVQAWPVLQFLCQQRGAGLVTTIHQTNHTKLHHSLFLNTSVCARWCATRDFTWWLLKMMSSISAGHMSVTSVHITQGDKRKLLWFDFEDLWRHFKVLLGTTLRIFWQKPKVSKKPILYCKARPSSRNHEIQEPVITDWKLPKQKKEEMSKEKKRKERKENSCHS
jgi:hypothetical protein